MPGPWLWAPPSLSRRGRTTSRPRGEVAGRSAEKSPQAAAEAPPLARRVWLINYLPLKLLRIHPQTAGNYFNSLPPALFPRWYFLAGITLSYEMDAPLYKKKKSLKKATMERKKKNSVFFLSEESQEEEKK